MKNRLKEFRLKNKKNQSDVAKVIGISQSQYAKYENNKTKFDLKKEDWDKLAKYFDVGVEYLMGFEMSYQTYGERQKEIEEWDEFEKNYEKQKEIFNSRREYIIDYLTKNEQFNDMTESDVNALYNLLVQLKTKNALIAEEYRRASVFMGSFYELSQSLDAYDVAFKIKDKVSAEVGEPIEKDDIDRDLDFGVWKVYGKHK